MDEFEIELKKGFLEEAQQAIGEVEQSFLDLEGNPNDENTINKIFRLAHNLKGSSKAVGFEDMGEFTHAFESFILRIKNKELPVTSQTINMLLRANDHLKMMIAAYVQDLKAEVPYRHLVEEMKNFKIEDVTQTSTSDGNVLEFESPSLGISLEKLEKKSISTPNPASLSDQSIRVSLQKVEKLINYVGEMVILQSVLWEQIQTIDHPILSKAIHQLSKVGREIQDLSMSLRMVPIKPTFQKMVRIVRDTAQALGKEVQLELRGEETELDKTILEKITDPLVHLVRNAVDHGIEKPEVRSAQGKNPTGLIILGAHHKSGRLIIEICDDGAGLNPETIRKKAVEKGLIGEQQKLTPQECYQLIFAPGFSTKEVVTDVSGRGVGMDVVRTNITELNGEISIESEVGKGATFRISLPLTLAIIDAMIVLSGPHKFVIPVNHVYETLRVDSKSVSQSSDLGDVLLLRGELVPIYRLADFFGIDSKPSEKEVSAIINRSGKRPFALVVDEIIGQSQVVIKQLSPELQGIKGVSGVTILGDGKPSLILEPPELVKRKLNKNKPLFMEVA